LTAVTSSEADTPKRRLERLYGSCRDDVYAYVASMLGDRALAEDVTATAFERAFRRRALFNPRRGSERAWLFGIARNAALDELRRRKRTASLPHEPDAGVDASEEREEDSLRRASVRTALMRLSPRERELIALKFHAGLANADIARVLHVSESNAGTMLHRALTTLRKACDEEA
jgi:RNA polymerase sigma-70 factor (ECF subfamily)